MPTEKQLIYLQDAIAVLEKDVADSKDALKTAYYGDKVEIQAEMNGVRAAIHLLKHHASHGGTVDAAPVVHGCWIDRTQWIGSLGHVRTECSVCGTIYQHKPGSRGDGKGGKFCEECGAKMDGGNDV